MQLVAGTQFSGNYATIVPGMNPEAIRCMARDVALRGDTDQREFVGAVAGIAVALAHDVIAIIAEQRDIVGASHDSGC